MTIRLCTVTTARDTRAHLERFVAGNLAGGVDHVVVCLDDPSAPDQADARAFLRDHPHVTCLDADGGWWADRRPPLLNVRQRSNANLVKQVLAELPSAVGPADAVDWVVHVDADEIVHVDRDVLAGCPPDVDAVRLGTWEVLSRTRWEREPDLFKTPLGAGDLALLHELGAIERPGMGAYFRGHLEGKAGVRPSAPLWLTLHKAVDADRETVPHFEDEALRVLHYESYSGEEFVRKWLAMVASGPSASARKGREGVAEALRTLVAKDLPPERLRPHVERLYAQYALDDAETLTELGLLTRLDPLAGTHTPRPFSPDALAHLERRFAELATAPKRRFRNAQAEREEDERLRPAHSPSSSPSSPSSPSSSPDPAPARRRWWGR